MPLLRLLLVVSQSSFGSDPSVGSRLRGSVFAPPQPHCPFAAAIRLVAELRAGRHMSGYEKATTNEIRILAVESRFVCRRGAPSSSSSSSSGRS